MFYMKGSNVRGPNGLNGKLYHCCWEIVKKDALGAVKTYFLGDLFPKSFTHTNLILILKKPIVQCFIDIRPISSSTLFIKLYQRW